MWQNFDNSSYVQYTYQEDYRLFPFSVYMYVLKLKNLPVYNDV